VSEDGVLRASGRIAPAGHQGPPDHAARSVGADIAGNAVAGPYRASVAVLDTGVSPSAGLNLVGWYDATSPRPLPLDDNGHGTHVAGIVGGTPAGAFRGVAPGAPIVAVKVLDARAEGLVSDAIRGLDWCVANREALRLAVVNISFGRPVTQSWRTDPLCRAVGRAIAAGIVVVAAAGNQGDGYGGIDCPANHPGVITVGAVRTNGTASRRDDAIASFSARGPTPLDRLAKPDLLAPGNRVVSLRAPGAWLDVMHPENQVGDSGRAIRPPRHYVLSGTSMAAPVVAGAALLARQAWPQASPNVVKAALMVSAQPLGGWDPVLGTTRERYDWMAQGAGYVNVPGAVLAAGLMTVGEVHLPGLGEPGMTTIGDASISWGDCVLWGARVVPVRADKETAEDVSCVLWGDSSAIDDDDGEDAVEGTSVFWGDRPVARNDRPVCLDGDP
jgi:serine protease AprX